MFFSRIHYYSISRRKANRNRILCYLLEDFYIHYDIVEVCNPGQHLGMVSCNSHLMTSPHDRELYGYPSAIWKPFRNSHP